MSNAKETDGAIEPVIEPLLPEPADAINSESVVREKQPETDEEEDCFKMSKSDFNIEKLRDSENYHDWCFAISNVLTLKGLKKCIKAKAGRQPIVAEEEDATKLDQAKSILALCVEKNLFVHIRSCETALEIWNKFQSLFEDKGLKRKISLLRTLISYKLDECDTMQEYIDGITNTASKLQSIGFTLTDDWTTAIMLAGLTEKFDPFIMTLEASANEMTADEVKQKLLDTQMEGGSKGAAFLSKKNNRNGKQKTNKKNKGKKRKCYICESELHLANTCPSKKVDEKKEKKNEKSDTAKAFIAMLSVCKKNEWYLDSGASSHMSPHSDILFEKKNASVGEITIANNECLKVECIGKSRIKIDDESIDVNDVLHIPKLGANLLSVYKMVSHGNTIVFNANGCSIYDSTNKLLKVIKPVDGVYKLCAPMNDICILANKKESNAMMWHRRFGHLNFGMLRKLNAAADGIDVSNDDVQIKNCKICALGKQHREPFTTSEKHSSKILELVHTDLCGPMENKSLGGARYMLTFTDDFSRKTFLYFLKEKSQVAKTFVQFKKAVENETDSKLKCIRSDNGMEYMSTFFDEYCKENGIQHQLTCTYTPEQNGVAERANRSIIEKAKCMLFDADLEMKFWAEACNTAAYVMNRTPRVRLQNKTPLEMWTGTKPDVSNLRIFGSKITVHVPKEKRKKWSAKATEMIFIGYDQQKKGFRCFDTESSKVIVSRDVKFFETLSSTVMMNNDEQSCDADKNDETDDSKNDTFESIENSEPEAPANNESTESESDADSNVTIVNRPSTSTPNASDTVIDEIDETTSESMDDPKDEDYRTRAQTSAPSTPRQSTREKKQVRPFQVVHFALFAGEPQTVNEAFKSDDHEKWVVAMKEEMLAHKQNGTWTLSELPEGRKAIKMKWVFKIKHDGGDGPDRYKARLVAKGYAQKAGIDYEETYSPVVRNNTIRFLMAFAAENGMKIFQMDAITAFLQGELTEEIYTEQPESFKDGTNRVCRLNKAIYGLKQAGRVWNQKLDGFLIKVGFTKSKCDPCVYIKANLIIAVYVDDLLIFYKYVSDLNDVRKQLHTNFRMKDIGEAKCCLGINIHQGTNYIELDQSRYILEVLEKFGMAQCKPCKSPSELNLKLTKSMIDENKSITGTVPYQQLVGSLLYISNGTRPDIAYSVSEVSRFNGDHAEPHWTATKRILRYLRGTVEKKLRYERGATSMHAFCDADWGSESENRKSRTGYVVMFAGAAISWHSKQQQIVALSSTEAEYIALSSTVREALWTLQLQNEICQKSNGAFTIYCDNQSAIKLASSDAYRPRTKHIDIRLHHVRDQLQAGVIELQYIPTEAQVADSLTKAVTGEKTAICANGMGLKND